VREVSEWHFGKIRVQPFVSHGNVTDLERNSDHQPDDKEAVRGDDNTRLFEGHRIFHEIHHGLRQLPLMSGVVGLCHPHFFPGKPLIVPKCHVDHKKDGCQAKVVAVAYERQKRVVHTYDISIVPFVFLVFGETSLEFDVNESPRADVRYISQLGNWGQKSQNNP